MQIGLIIIGDEILSGKRADKHFPKVVELLQARGLSLGWARYVGDDRQRITADLRDAFAAARAGALVFSCGGIGATPDDHTRQCAAAALERPLVLHPQARELIIERMREMAAEQGTDVRARSGRQPAPAEHGRLSGRRRDHPESVQPHSGLRDPLRAGRRRAGRAAASASCPAFRSWPGR